MTRADDLIQYGLAEVGDPYVYGAEGPESFDCSGLMLWIFNKVGVRLPRTAAEQQQYVQPVAEPRPGDLVFWGAPAYHVALYVGGGQVLSAPRTGATVRVQDVWGEPTYGRVPGIGSTSPVAAAAAGVIQPIANTFDAVADRVGNTGRLLLFVGGGTVLVILGLWQITKGSE